MSKFPLPLLILSPALAIAACIAMSTRAHAGELSATEALCVGIESVTELVGTNLPTMRTLLTDNTGKRWMILVDRETGAYVLGWLDFDAKKFCSVGARNGVSSGSQG